MILSERGAINSAISDGGFHLYPAGKLIDMIKSELSGDDLKGNFDPSITIDKLSHIKGPADATAAVLFQKDMNILCDRLASVDASYDIESIFDMMIAQVPAMAKRYYGLDKFEAPRPQVVEYFFEGHSDLYKDSDWTAFNVSKGESHDLGVPVGTYIKRDQVAPGQPEFVTLHEANHAMQEAAMHPAGFHQYIPWMDEGLADVLALMMLFRATGNEEMMVRLKNYNTDLMVTNFRKVTYLYGDQTAALLLLRGRLPFAKALMRARKRGPLSIDWNMLSNKIRAGWDPHIAVATAYIGDKQEAFRKKLERDEAIFRKDSDLDQSDLRILSMFLATQPPACLSPADYSAALWFADGVAKRPCPHSIDPEIIPAALRNGVGGWRADAPIQANQIPETIWKKVPELGVKVVIREDDVPPELKAGADVLASSYFIIKRKIGDVTVYDPYGGGLPYRIGTGEIRCVY